jgi:chromosome segregation ATPase
MWEEIQSLKQTIQSYEQTVRDSDEKVKVLDSENNAHRMSLDQQEQKYNTLKNLNQTIEQKILDENQSLKQSIKTLELQLQVKDNTIHSLKEESQITNTVLKQDKSDANKAIEALQLLLESKGNEMILMKQNMQHILDKEAGRNHKLEIENRKLKHAIKGNHPFNGTDLHDQEKGTHHPETNFIDTKHDIDDASFGSFEDNNDLNYDSDEQEIKMAVNTKA